MPCSVLERKGGGRRVLVCSSKMKAAAIFGREEVLLISYSSDREARFVSDSSTSIYFLYKSNSSVYSLVCMNLYTVIAKTRARALYDLRNDHLQWFLNTSRVNSVIFGVKICQFRILKCLE
jgi:hypothetical protein